MGALHTLGVLFGAEQLDGVIRRAVRLHSLEALLRIVENHTGRIHGNRCIGDNAGIMPTLFGVIVHDKHMVGKDFTKTQFGLVGRFGLRRRSTLDSDIQHGKSLFSINLCSL